MNGGSDSQYTWIFIVRAFGKAECEGNIKTLDITQR